MSPLDWTIHLPAGVTPADVDLLPASNLTRHWVARWRERGDSPVIRDIDGRWLTASEMEEQTRQAAERLLAGGLRRGDRLLIVAASSVRFVISYVAALRAGLTVVPINPAYTRSEVTRIVGACAPAGAVVDSDERAAWVREAAGSPLQIFGTSLELADGEQTSDGAQTELDDAAATDTALLIYTSGTTGQPKGVPLSHANLLSSASAVNLAWRWDAEDRLLLTLPLFHVHGLGVGVNGSLCAGAAVVLRPAFDAADVAENCREGATLFFGVPAMYQRLIRAGEANALASLRLIVSGSAPLPAELAREIEAAAGQIPLERYGMSETIMLAGNPCDGERRPGTVGFPFPGVDLRLAETGEVQVRGPNVIDHYIDRPEASAEAFTDDGWFRSGDLGEFDADGYLHLVGRSKELIISGGYNVYPREIEEALGNHPAVREVAVVGRPSEAWGEEVTAVVVAAGELTEQELRDYASERLARYKVPKRVEFTAELPRNALGKVVRSEL